MGSETAISGGVLFVRKVRNKYSVVIFFLLQYAPTDYLVVKRKPLRQKQQSTHIFIKELLAAFRGVCLAPGGEDGLCGATLRLQVDNAAAVAAVKGHSQNVINAIFRCVCCKRDDDRWRNRGQQQ